MGGVNCSSCGCNDQGEFKMNEVQLDDKNNNSRKNQVYGGAYTNVSPTARASSLSLNLSSAFRPSNHSKINSKPPAEEAGLI